MTYTVQSEAATHRQFQALRAVSNLYHLDLESASRFRCGCETRLLTRRAASQLIDYLGTEEARERFTIKPQSRCTRCRVPKSECECEKEINL